MAKWMEISAKEIEGNPLDYIRNQWMLITSGTDEKFNTMTANWGGVGPIWNRDCVFAFVRESRYTNEFLLDNDYFTLSFFDKKYKDALTILGRKSGRDCDKIKEAGMTPEWIDGAVTFSEAELVLICKKLFVQKMELDSITEQDIRKEFYSPVDPHDFYIGEIMRVLKREEK